MPARWITVYVRLVLIYYFLSRVTNAISRWAGRPLGLVDLSCRSWTTRFDVGQPLYGITSFCFTDIICHAFCTTTIALPRSVLFYLPQPIRLLMFCERWTLQ